MELYDVVINTGNKIFLKAIEFGGPNSLVDLLNGQNTMVALDIAISAGVRATNYINLIRKSHYENILDNLNFREEYF
jgi:hypothetical protein